MPPYRCVVGRLCAVQIARHGPKESPPLRSLAEDSFGMSEYQPVAIVLRLRANPQDCAQSAELITPMWRRVGRPKRWEFPRPKREMFTASSFGTHVRCPISRGVNKRPFCAVAVR